MNGTLNTMLVFSAAGGVDHEVHARVEYETRQGFDATATNPMELAQIELTSIHVSPDGRKHWEALPWCIVDAFEVDEELQIAIWADVLEWKQEVLEMRADAAREERAGL